MNRTANRGGRAGAWLRAVVVALPLAALAGPSWAQSAEDTDDTEDTEAAAEAAVGADGEPIPESVTHQMYLDMKLGKLDIHGDNAVVQALVLQRDLPISYEYVAALMRTPNAFGNGPACVVCHGSDDKTESYRGMDLSSCEGILRGATEKPSRSIVVPGEPEKSLLVQMLRNNRMPLGVSFFQPVDTESIQAVRDWIEHGAKNNENFQENVLPLFSTEDVFGSGNACIECHESHRDPPSFNEVNLTSYEGIMKGAFSRTRGKEGKPGIPIVIPYDAEASPLYQRLTMNRMPPGIDPGEPSDHPNTLLLMRWIEQGAKCD